MATFNQNGLIIEDLTTIDNNISNEMLNIDAELDLSSDSPAGQMKDNISILNYTNQINLQNAVNALDPEQAVGTQLDKIIILNNIKRKSGTFTIQDIDIVINKPVDLQGLDSQALSIDGTGFTIFDSNGNEYILLNSESFLVAGTFTRQFRAAKLGKITSNLNTITNIKTITIGVTSVNNTTIPSITGQPGETDAELRARRRYSTSLSAKSFFDSLYGNILSINGVSDVRLYENDSDITNSIGVPEHSIWLIVEGGVDQDIADAIYVNKTVGTGMKGVISVEVPKADGTVFYAKFDRPLSKTLYLRFDVKVVSGVLDQVKLKEYIVNNFIVTIASSIDTANIICIALDGVKSQTDLNAIPLNVEFSKDNMTWYNDILEVDLANEKWVLNTTNINISTI